ncbi:MAG TPA: hypothetical protein VGX25_00870 [Actinophytocola sp.]|uniref:hypothetical protein n=1 Tax=Actinophytocola sp. TaxID=1872138 RepID=UPI002DDD3F6A|nr:hypothetical protein [Actinophytocola sp.]HEV2777928.1 hypothetical protein [Actinophytocola sp.]
MSDVKRALVLHVAGSGEPLVFALSDRGAKTLAGRLPTLMNSGGVDTPELADGSTVAVNFAHVVTAHLDELPPLGRVYGSVTHRGHGFNK